MKLDLKIFGKIRKLFIGDLVTLSYGEYSTPASAERGKILSYAQGTIFKRS